MRIAICDDGASELGKIREVLREFIHSKQSEYEIVLETFLGGHDLLKSSVIMPPLICGNIYLRILSTRGVQNYTDASFKLITPAKVCMGVHHNSNDMMQNL